MSSRFWFKIYYRNTDGKLKFVGAARDSIIAAAAAQNVSLYYGDVTVKCSGLVCATVPAFLPSRGKPEVYLLSRQIDDGFALALKARRDREVARAAKRASQFTY